MTTRNILLGLLIVAVFAIGLYLGRMNFGNTIRNNTIDNKQSGTMPTPVRKDTTATNTQNTTSEESIGTSIASHMSDDQKQMMRAFGIDVEKLTPAMITCAETSLGTDRFNSIKNGSAPSLTEKMELVACYK